MVHSTWGLVIAGGKSEQLSSGVTIPFLNLGSKPVLSFALQAYENCPEIEGVVVVTDKERLESVQGLKQLFGFSKVQKVIAGGSQRQACVLAGLKALDEEVSIVSVHDASRPCVKASWIEETVKAAKRYGGGVAAAAIADVVKETAKGLAIGQTLDNSKLYVALSPQTFRREWLTKGYELAAKKKMTVEEDSAAVALVGEELHLVLMDSANIKIRTPDDLNLAASLLRS